MSMVNCLTVISGAPDTSGMERGNVGASVVGIERGNVAASVVGIERGNVAASVVPSMVAGVVSGIGREDVAISGTPAEHTTEQANARRLLCGLGARMLLAITAILIAVGCGTSQPADHVTSDPDDSATTDAAGIDTSDPDDSATTDAAGVDTSDPDNGSGSDSGSTTPTAADATRVRTASSDQSVLPVIFVDETGAEVIVDSIERIIPLDGDLAEIVFALGLGDNVVATDLSATYPPEADALPEIGYQRALSAETVASFDPTVLLATDIAGPPEALDDLRRLGYPLVIIPNNATPTGAGQKIRAVAAALGVSERGVAIADSLDAAIAEATVPSSSKTSSSSRPRVLALYVRGTVAQLVLGESMNTHWLITAAGGLDVSEALGVHDTAPVSTEAILAVAPDVLLVPEAGLESVGGVDGLLGIAGLVQTPAGQRRQVLAYDDQLLLGNGPRTAQMLTRLRDDLSSVVVAETDSQTDQEIG